MTDTLKALIIDDERLARKELRSLLAEHAAIEIVGEAENVEQAIRLIETEKPNVVFLDIQLSGETGFDLLEKVTTDFKTIFVTAFDAFAIRAFEVNALDYLLKPVNPDRLKQAIEKLSAMEKCSPIEFRPLEPDDRIFVETGARSLFLKVNSISHISASGDYSEVFTVEGQKFLIEKSLREWEERLPEKSFARIHRSTIVSLDEIEKIENWFNRTLQIRLKDYPEPFAVSRRYAARLKEKFA